MKEKESSAVDARSFAWLRVSMLAAVVAVAGCGAGDGAGTPTNSVAASVVDRPVDQSDLQIARNLYDDDQRTPVGFYSDPPPSGFDYVATAHLKNTDIDVTDASIEAMQSQYELCTNDWVEAFNWSEAAAKRSSAYSDLVAANENERFFEFDRVRPGNPAFYTRARVFKCAYLDRGDVDLRFASGTAGWLNQRPLTADELRRLSEYLWQFTPYNNYGHVVLKSSGVTGTGHLDHALIIANLVSKGLSRECDRIDVIAWRYSADVASGMLQLDLQQLWSFGARDDFGVTQLCNE